MDGHGRTRDLTTADLTRRGLLGGGGVIAGLAIAGCDLFAIDPEDDRGGGQQGGAAGSGGTDRKEAPALEEQVASGSLPPLEDRLPRMPLTLEPYDRAGIYGGTLRTISVGTGEVTGHLQRLVGYDHLVRWKSTMQTWTDDDVVMNIAERVETNEDKTEYIFHLRPGMKWSDGEPFGADDIVFWYEDVLLDEELTPVVPDWLRAGDETVVVEKVDDSTVVFRFGTTHGLLLPELAANSGAAPTAHPAHYLRDFHIRHNPDVAGQADEEGLDHWTNIFVQKASPWENPELPVLNAWQATSAVGENTQRVVTKRNPYYWKVDSDGRQLPYLDEVSFRISADQEVAKLQAMNGDVDLVYLTTQLNLSDKPMFARASEDGEFSILDLIYEDSNMMAFCLNLAHQDPAMRQLFNDIDLRIGLSHAVNREEIIQIVFQRQGEPHQVAPLPGTPYYDERFAKQYTEFSLDRANEHLDRVLPMKDGNGMRLRPDGQPFRFRVDVASDFRGRDVDTLEIMRGQFRQVGVDMRIKAESGSLFWERLDANLHDASVFGCGGGLDPILQPNFFFPDAQELFEPGVPWTYWHRFGGLDGAIPDNPGVPVEEPPPAAVRQIELYRDLQESVDSGQQVELMRELLRIAQEQFWCIGICTPAENFGIVKNRLHNVQNPMIDDYPWQTPGPTNPPQYFIDEGS